MKIWQIKFSGWAFLNTPVIQILPTGQWGCNPWSVPKISHSLDVRLKSLSVSAAMFEEERSGEGSEKKLDSDAKDYSSSAFPGLIGYCPELS